MQYELTSCFSSQSSLLNAAAAAARRPLINITFIAGGLQGAKGPPTWNAFLGRDWPAEGIAASATRLLHEDHGVCHSYS